MRQDKQKAIQLRLSGKSYNEINKTLNIPKSTLSSWLKKLPDSNKIKNTNLSNIKKIWAQNIITFNKKRALLARETAYELQDKSAKEIVGLSYNELKLIGTALYWAEGYKRAKWNPFFCNSDSEMIKLMMKFFREICHVPEDRFRPQVQIHPNISREKAEQYWSNITGLKKNTFSKPLMQISKSSKNKRPVNILPYGTFRIRIANAQVLYKLKGWIEGLAKTVY